MTWLAHLITRDLDQDPDHVQVNSLSVYNSFLDDVASSQDYRRTVQKERGAIRAGSGHFFHGAGRVSGLRFWLGSGSGYWKCPRVNYGP